MKSTRLQILALAVAGVVSIPAGIVSAQYRVGDDGRALDASNRVGSAGRNDGSAPVANSPYQISGNQIVTGNVTGGRQFRGNVGYRAANEFRGQTAGALSDRFIRESAGVGDVSNPNFNLNNPRPFYGESRTVQPPAGYVQNRWSGAYVPPPAGTSIGQLNENYRSSSTLDLPAIENPSTGELILPGPVDATNQQTLFTASPLYGVRQWRTGEQADRSFLENYTTLGRTNDPLGRLRLSDDDVARMREELNNAEGSTPIDAAQPRQGGTGPGGAADPAATPNPLSLTNPVGTPANPAVADQRVRQQALTADLATGQGAQSRLLMSAPELQSTQYAELQKRLQRQRELQGNKLPADVQAQVEFQEQRRVKEELDRQADAAAQANRPPQDDGEGAAPTDRPKTGPGAVGVPDFQQMDPAGQQQQDAAGAPKTPQDLSPEAQAERDQQQQAQEQQQVPPGVPSAAKPDPVKIRRLAEGVKAKGLADLLDKAESLMKEGKFTSALDQYAAAEQVAPNNPLVLMGRANAELGASYYARAEGHLREAFLADPALLMGQYDLREFLGAERLGFLVKDLKEIANSEKSQVRPVFLLAYIAYNTGNERQAAGYLELAEQRAGSSDPLFPLLREHWKLPEAPSADDENK